jgi:hypothetical protein
MKFNEMTRKKAHDVIDLHEANGLWGIDAINAAIVTLDYALKTGLYPGYEPINQKALNYLKHLKSTSNPEHQIIE